MIYGADRFAREAIEMTRPTRRRRAFAGRPKPRAAASTVLAAHSLTALPDPRGLANAEIAELEIDERRRRVDDEYRAWLDAVVAEYEHRGLHCRCHGPEDAARLWR
jgi:hypothetical protein